MISFFRSRRAKQALAAAAVATFVFVAAGCGTGNQQQKQQAQATLVKTMQVIKRDTPLVYDYTGFVQATQDMDLKAQVTGRITAKYFKGGDTVTAGQPLYKIDSRTYTTVLQSAQAAYDVAAVNEQRYMTLYKQNAVSKQTLDNMVMARRQAEAALNAAQINMTDTTVVAPFSGRIGTTVLEVGNYVTQGQTTMANITNTNPVFIKFTMGEPEYLQLTKSETHGALDNLTAILSDGSTYPLKGKVAEVNKGITDGTGTMTIKALFDNPNQQLLPGMFAHIQATTGTEKGALLIPKRAVTELMYKRFVYVVGSDNKVTMKEITLGNSVGRMYMVTGGLDGSETIVVEGTGKIRQGSTVKPEPMTEADLDTSDKKADSSAAKK